MKRTRAKKNRFAARILGPGSDATLVVTAATLEEAMRDYEAFVRRAPRVGESSRGSFIQLIDFGRPKNWLLKSHEVLR